MIPRRVFKKSSKIRKQNSSFSCFGCWPSVWIYSDFFKICLFMTSSITVSLRRRREMVQKSQMIGKSRRILLMFRFLPAMPNLKLLHAHLPPLKCLYQEKLYLLLLMPLRITASIKWYTTHTKNLFLVCDVISSTLVP